MDYTEWNLNLIESMADTISPWWDVYAEGSAAILDEIQNKILTSLDALASQVKGMLDQNSPHLTQYYDY